MEEEKRCVVCGTVIEKKKYFDKNGKFKGYGAYARTNTCSRSCTNVYRAGIDLEARFWSGVDSSGGPDACWPWMKSRVKQGYGRTSWNDRLELSHRVAWALAHNNGQTPELDVLHTCDNPPCCNPAHLFTGSHADNMGDMVAKGRSLHRIGEANTNVTLTDVEVLEIREAYRNGIKQVLPSGKVVVARPDQMQLAALYGVDQTTISKIVRNKLWTHLEF